MRNLTPEQRPDKNGKIVTRHVRSDNDMSHSRAAIPAPAVSKQDEQQSIDPLDFEATKKRNHLFITKDKPVQMRRENFSAIGTFMESASEPDRDGDSRGYTAAQIVNTGDMKAIEMLNFLMDHRAVPTYIAIDLWDAGIEGGIFEHDKDYLETPFSEDDNFMTNLTEFFEKQTEMPLYDLTEADLQEVATVFRRYPDSLDEAVEYANERSGLTVDGFDEWMNTKSALRSGTI